jgi:hypothetical protein
MQTQDKLLTYGFAIFSLITSFLFVFYAVIVNSSPNASEWLKTFAYVVGGYGLFNIYIISWAWRSGITWAPKANMVIGICFFGVFAMETFRDGVQDLTTEVFSVMGLAALLLVNWYAVKKIVARKNS